MFVSQTYTKENYRETAFKLFNLVMVFKFTFYGLGFVCVLVLDLTLS